jgi:HEAT repeat protein
MRHPFDGVISENVSRRTALGLLASALVGGTAAAQVATTLAIGEEGGGITTKAIGEEGGPATNGSGETGGSGAAISTEPFGEEAGKVVSRAVPGLEDGAAAKPPVTEAKGEDAGPATKKDGEAAVAPPPLTKGLREAGGRVSTAAMGEEGGAEPAAPMIVPVKPNTIQLDDAKAQTVWKDLGGTDATKAVQACAVLYGSKTVIAFLTKNLKPGMVQFNQATEAAVARMITNADSDDYEVREAAETDLSKLGDAAVPAIEKALAATRSAELRMRLTRVLEAIKSPPARNQARRSLEVLVALRTPEAKELLTKLASGDEKDWVTMNAKTALERASK